MPRLTIDNREIEVPSDTKVIEAAQQLGIVIPRFCYHPALGAVGACRVCAVAFKQGPVKGIQMSCMVDALDGMVISTTDAEAVDFRRHVIEWLMLNHPHDCPVCDEGGHCLLQDTTVSGGHGMRRYQGRKRTHVDQDMGLLVQHEMNRCIQCYRCARFYQEYAGYRDLGVLGIGSRVWFGRSRPGRLESPFAGNLIDLCPTGVYTDKPSRNFGRRWDFQRAPSICLHCSLGCNLTVSARYRQVVRHEARPNDRVNGHFICDRGRYGYGYASCRARPDKALVDGKPADIDDALAQAGQRLGHCAAQHGPESVAVIASPRCSLETLAVMAKICRQNQWQGPVVAMTAREAETLRAAAAGLKPGLAVCLGDIGAARTVVVIGADPINEAPMLALALRQAQRRGGHVTVIDPRGIQLPLPFDHLPAPPGQLSTVLQHLTRKLQPGREAQTAPELPDAMDAQTLQALADRLAHSKGVVLVCGTDLSSVTDIAQTAFLAQALQRMEIETGIFHTLTGANAFAAAMLDNDLCAVDRLTGTIEAGQTRALVVTENDLWRRFPDRPRLLSALQRLDLLILLDYLDTPLNEKAQIFIPTRTIYEAGGHWINQEGRVQAAQAVLQGGEPVAITGNGGHPPRIFDDALPGGQPIAAWQAAVKLSRTNKKDETPDLDSFLAKALSQFHPALAAFDDNGEDRHVFAQAADLPAQEDFRGPGETAPGNLTLLLVDRTLGTEPLSTRSPALADAEHPPAAQMHPLTIEALGLRPHQLIVLSAGEEHLRLPLQADARMAPGVVVIARHHALDWQIFGETRVTLEPGQIKQE